MIFRYLIFSFLFISLSAFGQSDDQCKMLIGKWKSEKKAFFDETMIYYEDGTFDYICIHPEQDEPIEKSGKYNCKESELTYDWEGQDSNTEEIKKITEEYYIVVRQKKKYKYVRVAE